MLLLVLLFKDYRKKQFAGAMSGILAFSIILYGVVPIIFIVFQKQYYDNKSIYGFLELYNMVFTSANFYSHLLLFTNYSVGFIFLFFGHNLVFKKNKFINISIENRQNSLASTTTMRKFGLFCLFVGVISLVIYIYALGGIVSAISKSEFLRGFSSTVEVNSYLSLFKIPAALTPMSFYLLFINYKSKKKSVIDLIFLLISFFCTLIFLLLNAGKTAIIILGIFIMYAFFSKKQKRVWLKMLIVSLLMFFSISLLDDLFSYLAYGADHIQSYTTEQSFLRLVRQFSYPFQIELHLNDITNEYGFLCFKNIFTDIFGLLPGVSFEQSYDMTSAFFNGADWKLVSGVPNDLLSYGFLNLGILGTAIYMFIIGLLVGYIDKCLAVYPSTLYKKNLLAFLFACKMFSHVNSVDLQPIIQYDLSLILLVVMVIIIYRKSYKKFYYYKKVPQAFHQT